MLLVVLGVVFRADRWVGSNTELANAAVSQATYPVTIVVRNAASGQPIGNLPFVVRDAGQIGNRPPTYVGGQTDESGTGMFNVPSGNFLVQSVETSQYVGTLPITVGRGPLVATLVVYGTAASENSKP